MTMPDGEDIKEFIDWLEDEGYTVKSVEGDSEGRGAPAPGTRETYSVTFTKFERADFPPELGGDDE